MIYRLQRLTALSEQPHQAGHNNQFGGATAQVSGFVVTFYDVGGSELGSDQQTFYTPTYLTAGQSLAWTEFSGTDTIGNYRNGLISRGDAVRSAVAQLLFSRPGASHQRMERIREHVGQLCRGWWYRCRHGYTSATRPDPARPKNLYLREDQILPRPAAVPILHAGDGRRPRNAHRITEVAAPAQVADLIDQLRSSGVSLIYDPATNTLSTASDAAAISVG